MSKLSYLSVCSGIEAATVAWHHLGWAPVAFSEIEPFPAAVLAHHYPETPNWGDMTKFKEWTNAVIDVLVGGTPCQSYSVAGLRAGLDDPRGDLMLTYVAVARKYRPRWVVWENVPGVLSSNKGRDFGSFLGLLTGQHIDAPPTGWQNSGVIPGYKSAYGVAWRVLDAQFAGVPQRRRRVFVVGYLGDWRRAAAVLLERHSLLGHPPPNRKTGPPVAALTANGVGTCGADDNQGQAGHLIPATVSLTCGDRGMSVDQACGGMAIPVGLGDNGSEGGETIICMATGQASAEIGIGIGTTLNRNHEAPIVCGTLCNNGKAAGSATQQDAENGMLVTHTLRGEGFDASEDGTGRGTPLVAVPLQEVGKRTGTSTNDPRAGIGIGAAGDPMYTLQAGAQHGVAVAFDCKASAGFMPNPSEVSPTLRSMSSAKGHDNGGGQLAVAFNLRGREGGAMAEMAEMASLRASSGGSSRSYIAASAVRRLTPRECERLQEFPDDYTLIPNWQKIKNVRPEKLDHDYLKYLARGGVLTYEECIKAATDGPRYKALGNSMHTGCIRWLGERIEMVEAVVSPPHT